MHSPLFFWGDGESTVRFLLSSSFFAFPLLPFGGHAAKNGEREAESLPPSTNKIFGEGGRFMGI